jgi:DNA-binding response OmpR family regulator
MGCHRVPSFSARPGFPVGLRVLLLDSDKMSLDATDAMLRECNYVITPTSSFLDATSRIVQDNSAFDVLLVDAKSLGSRAADSAAFMKLVKTAPLIIMAEKPTQEDVLLSIKLGAVDFIEKPVCLQKVRTMWQHTVRQMLKGFSLEDPPAVLKDESLGEGEDWGSLGCSKYNMFAHQYATAVERRAENVRNRERSSNGYLKGHYLMHDTQVGLQYI